MIKRIFSFLIKSQYSNLTSISKLVFIFIALSLKLTIGANAEEVKKKFNVGNEKLVYFCDNTRTYNKVKDFFITKYKSCKTGSHTFWSSKRVTENEYIKRVVRITKKSKKDKHFIKRVNKLITKYEVLNLDTTKLEMVKTLPIDELLVQLNNNTQIKKKNLTLVAKEKIKKKVVARNDVTTKSKNTNVGNEKLVYFCDNTRTNTKLKDFFITKYKSCKTGSNNFWASERVTENEYIKRVVRITKKSKKDKYFIKRVNKLITKYEVLNLDTTKLEMVKTLPIDELLVQLNNNTLILKNEEFKEENIIKVKKIEEEKSIEEERKRIAKIKIEEEEKKIAIKKAAAEERKRIAKIKIEEEEKKISQKQAEEQIKNQKLISSNKSKFTTKSKKKKLSNSGNFLEALAKKEVIEGSKKKIIRYECQQSWDLTTEDYRPLLDIYELDLRDRTLKGIHRYITDKEYTDERVYPILATDKDRVLVRYDSPNGNFSTKFFFNYGTDQSIVAADNSYKTKSKCVNRDYFVDIKIAKKNVAKVDTSKNDLKALELAKKEAILAQKEIEKIEKEQKQLLANQNKILKDQKQKTKTTKVAKLKVYDDPKKFTTSLSSSISKSQFQKYNATSTVSYLFFESSENYLISLELLYRAYDLNADADKIRSHIAYMKESKSSEKNRLSSTRQIVQTQSIVISNNIKDQSLQLSEQGKVYYAQSLPYALNAAISTYNLYHAATNTVKNVGNSGDIVFGILNDLNNVIGIAQILPQLPAYSKNMYRTTKLIISGAKVRKIKDSTNVKKALDELNLET